MSVFKQVIMKKEANIVPIFFVAGIMTLALTGFNTPTKLKKQPLVVERQEWILQFMVGNIPSEDFHIGITMDVPVDGDPVIVDSVVRLLNRAIYLFLDDRSEPRFKPERVFCNDGKQLLKHYREAYKPFIADTCYKGFGLDCCPGFFHYLTATMVEQTEKYVTYRVSTYFVGEGDFEYSDWVTFYKSDGHRLNEVISDDDFLRFLEENPDQRANLGWDDMQALISAGYDFGGRNYFGLKKDKVWNEYIYAPGIIDTTWFDMKVIKPYLSKEAQELLK